MSCYHPLHAWARKIDTKYDLIFSDSDSPVEKNGHIFPLEMKVPCGQCIGCRLDYARSWMLRCAFEAEKYPGLCYFVTLTYDDDHLPVRFSPNVIDNTTGEVYNEIVTNPLEPRDLQLFMKRLREYYSRHFDHNGIRFYACGEYGSHNGRPHYHISFFNLPIPDLKLRGQLPSGFNEFDSKIIRDVWQKGRISVSSFSPATASYVARYMLKKLKGRLADVYEKNGLVPEFSRCSNRPGIGAEFFEKNKERIYKFDSVFLSGRKFKPPPYFDRLFSLSDEEFMSEIKDRRRHLVLSSIDPETDLSEAEYNIVREKNKQYSVSKLPRNYT